MIAQPEHSWRSIALGYGTHVEHHIPRDHAVEARIESSRARRQVTAHAGADEDDLLGSRMTCKESIHYRLGRLFPFMGENEALLAQCRPLARAIIGQYVVAVLMGILTEQEIKLF